MAELAKADIPSEFTLYIIDGTYYLKSGRTGKVTTGASPSILIENALTDGCSIFIKSGTYTFTTPVTITDKGVRIRGEGPSTVIVPASGNYAFVFTNTISRSYTANIGDLFIYGNAVIGCSGISLFQSDYSKLENLIIDARVNGILIDTCYNTHIRDTRIQATDAGGHGIKVSNTGVGISADTMISKTTVHDTDYGMGFYEGANGYQVLDCVVLGSDVAGYYVEGGTSGGWFTNAIADQCAGDGFYITDTATWYVHAVHIVNCWAVTCLHGLVINGRFGASGVFEVMISNSFFTLANHSCIRIEGYAKDIMLNNVIARDANLHNDSAMDTSPLLVYNGPQMVNVNNCHFGWTFNLPANRAYACRVWSDLSAVRDTIVYFDRVTLRDEGDATKATIGQKSTHGAFNIGTYASGIWSVDNVPITIPFVTEAGSTGAIFNKDGETWCTVYSTLPVASLGYDGMIVYYKPAPGAKSAAYICNRDMFGNYHWTLLGQDTYEESSGTVAVLTGGTIPHGLTTTPNRVFLSANSATPLTVGYTADATDITVYHNGVGAVVFSWRAEI